jgi:putative tricarboxylic transport membrane protein
MKAEHLAIGLGALALGAVIAVGAAQLPSEAGYGGVGPNFLPWVIGLSLMACGAVLAWQAASGGFRVMYEASGAAHGNWVGFAWVSAGILLNAATITTLGFILSCTLCFVLAVCGLKQAEGRLDLRPRFLLASAAIGFAVAAPVYWMFTQLLAINLPGLTQTGWL